MRITSQSYGVHRTHALPYYQIRMNLGSPLCELGSGNLRVKIVCTDENLELRVKVILQNGRNTAVSSPTHAVDIEYHIFTVRHAL
jgi:hypothetical protein